MKRCKVSAGLIISLLVLPLGVGLLFYSEAVSSGIRRGLDICGGVLIPSLFPFMALCCFLSRSGAARILSLPLAPLTKYIYKLPSDVGVTILLSMVGGYPVGAKMISAFLEEGKIDKPTAQRMLYFCVCASPSFLISAVGEGMLRDSRAGMALFLSQTCAALLLGAAVSLRAPKPSGGGAKSQPTGGTGSFVAAVVDASSSMLVMCAFAVLCSGLMALLSHSGLPGLAARVFSLDPAVTEAVASGLLEVSGGCLAAARLDGEISIILTSIFCSFGGISVILQVISFFGKSGLRIWPVLAGRLAHCALSLSLMLPLYRAFCSDTAVMQPSSPPVLLFDGKTVLMSVCLLCMCGILVSGEYGKKRGQGKNTLEFYSGRLLQIAFWRK